MNFCDFLIYGDDIKIRAILKRVFKVLHEDVPHLPISYSQEDFPIPYWIHESASETQRLLIDQIVEKVNIELGFRAFTIAGIDSGEIDRIHNRRDQKNVVYLFDEEQMSFMIFALEGALQIPGATIQVPDLDVLHPSPYPILDADIMINVNITTDSEAFKDYLTYHLRKIGVEDIPLDVNVTDLYDFLIEHLESMTDEEYRQVRIDMLKRDRQAVEQYLNGTGYEAPLTEGEERNFNQLLNQIDEAISRITSMTPFTLARSSRIFKGRFAFVDINRFQDSSSLFFEYIFKHELLHGLGIGHYTGIVLPFTNPLMEFGIGDFFQGSYVIPKQVDFYALRSLSCIYDLDSLRQRLPL